MSNKKKILLIDDERISYENTDFLIGKEYDIVYKERFDNALIALETEDFDLILLDLDLENIGDKGLRNGLKRIPLLKKEYPTLPIIILTNDRKQDTAIAAMDLGADYFFWKRDLKPKKCKDKIEQLTANKYLEKKLERIQIQKRYLEKRLHKVEQEKEHQFIGISSQIQEIKDELEEIAYEEPNTTILLTGETGVGKEVAAHYFYAHSKRNKYEFVPVNLSAITKEVFESELFGHKKGSFTGATEDRIGYFQEADKGIIFLDEIGEIDTDLQTKLLRILQDKKIRRIGESKQIDLDVQIVTATNKDLKEGILNRTIRKDFYHRISEIIIHIPPLRERREDIIPIIAYFLEVPFRLVEKNFFSKEAKDILLNYYWGGNVRELRTAVKNMKRLRRRKKRERFEVDCLPDEVLNYKPDEIVKATTSKLDDVAPEVRKTLIELQELEKLAITYHSRKGQVAKAYNTDTDGLRYIVVKKHYKNYPELFEKGFEHLKSMYKLK